jgi:hydroxymethylbilane synthase
MSQSGAAITLRLGSRKSPLAVRQSEMIKASLEASVPGLSVVIELIVTTGDRQQTWRKVPAQIGEVGGKGIFVKEIEEALLNNTIDAAVHSMKDMPSELPDGLGLAAIPEREDPRDALVTKNGEELGAMASGSRIGTGSPRRTVQILSNRPDLVMVPIRGNVGSRVEKVLRGELDGVVLAMAGLNRLGIRDAGISPIPETVCVPAAGQGILGLEARTGDASTLKILEVLNDKSTSICAAAERAFLAELGGGCLVPAGALAEINGDEISLRIALGDPGGPRLIRSTAVGATAHPEKLGLEAARSALLAGGREILRDLRDRPGA